MDGLLFLPTGQVSEANCLPWGKDHTCRKSIKKVTDERRLNSFKIPMWARWKLQTDQVVKLVILHTAMGHCHPSAQLVYYGNRHTMLVKQPAHLQKLQKIINYWRKLSTSNIGLTLSCSSLSFFFFSLPRCPAVRDYPREPEIHELYIDMRNMEGRGGEKEHWGGGRH